MTKNIQNQKGLCEIHTPKLLINRQESQPLHQTDNFDTQKKLSVAFSHA